jgi:hypothetical protein
MAEIKKYKDPAKRLIKGQDDLRKQFNNHIPESKLKHGSLKGKIPVYLSDGRTVVWIAKNKSVKETRAKYEQIVNKIIINGTDIALTDNNLKP